jgi:hypothetical protein
MQYLNYNLFWPYFPVNNLILIINCYNKVNCGFKYHRFMLSDVKRKKKGIFSCAIHAKR